MEIQDQTQGAVRVLKPLGPLVESDALDFRAKALEAAGENLARLVIDASGIAFLDSAGVEALADVNDELNKKGRSLKLAASNATVKQVIELTGYAQSFEFYEEVGAGVRSFL